MSNQEDAERLHEIAKEFHEVLRKLKAFCADTKDGRLWEMTAHLQEYAVDLYGHREGYQGINHFEPDQYSLNWDLNEVLCDIANGHTARHLFQFRVGNNWMLLHSIPPDENGRIDFRFSGRIDDELWTRYHPSKPELAPDA